MTSPELATFRSRDACVSCGSPVFHSVWSGHLDERNIDAFIRKLHYSADLECLKGAKFSLVKCDECGMMFHQHILTDDWLETLYTRWIDSQQIEAFEKDVLIADKRRKGFEQARQEVKNVLRLSDALSAYFDGPFRLLDFGCGDAQFLRLAQMFQFECIGVDSSENRQERAGAMGFPIYPDLTSAQADAGGKLHAVVLFQTLEHLVHPRETVEELASMMEIGGVMIISVPDCRSPLPPKSFDDFHNVLPLEHVNCFTPDTLRGFVERLGFQSLGRQPAHVTTKVSDLVKTEISRFYQPKTTSQYFRKVR